MLKKERKIPIKILKLEALLRRLPANHVRRKYIEEELARSYSGYRGEQALDYYVAQIPGKDHLIFQDLRLPFSKDYFFQIDLLLLTQRHFLILEAKNIAGTIFIDQNQLVRTIDDAKDSYPNPIHQAENQQYHFGNLIQNHTNLILPNTSFVVMTNSHSIIKPNPDYRAVAQKVIRPPVIRPRVSRFYSEYQKDIIEKKELQKLSRQLIKMHTPSDPHIIEQFQIEKNEILPGVFCEECEQRTIIRLQRRWRCTQCGKVDDIRFIHALVDYCLLMGPSITNQQCRSFLQLTSSSISSKLLRSLHLPYTGEYKNRAYHLSIKELQKWL